MQEIKRKNTRRIQLGNIPIGGGAPVSIQSMLSVKTSDRENAIQQIQELNPSVVT